MLQVELCVVFQLLRLFFLVSTRLFMNLINYWKSLFLLPYNALNKDEANVYLNQQANQNNWNKIKYGFLESHP